MTTNQKRFTTYKSLSPVRTTQTTAQHKAKVHIIHVVTEHIKRCTATYCLDAKLVKELEKQSFKGASDRLMKEVGTIAKKKGVKISVDVKNGVPQDIILSEQKAKNIDLIVIATHGQTGILKNLIGSVAEKVVKGAKCSVMVIK